MHWPTTKNDALLRHATALQQSVATQKTAIIHPQTAEDYHLTHVQYVTIRWKQQEITLPIERNEAVAENVIWLEMDESFQGIGTSIEQVVLTQGQQV